MSTPQKPYPSFPLFPHANGKWAKKIDGKTHYYGRWDNPAGALAEYTGENGHSVGGICHSFLNAKCLALTVGEICQSTFSDYRRTCEWIVAWWGENTPIADVTPQTLSQYKAHLAQRRSLRSLGNEVSRVRIVLKWAYEAGLIDKPVRFGPEFRKPSTRALRRVPREPKLFTPEQIYAILAECGTSLRAMVLLGVNCGYGPTDCCELAWEAIRDGWAVFPRPKTGIERECPLWPETRAALDSVKRAGVGPRVFVRPDGRPFTQDVVSKRFRAALLASMQQKGSFYWLRHVLETIGGGAKDQVALNRMMGHADGSMAGVYREMVDRERLERVAEHVRLWLHGSTADVTVR